MSNLGFMDKRRNSANVSEPINLPEISNGQSSGLLNGRASGSLSRNNGMPNTYSKRSIFGGKKVSEDPKELFGIDHYEQQQFLTDV